MKADIGVIEFMRCYFKPEKLNFKQLFCIDYPARALRALGLLLADGTPTVGGGKTF